MKISKEKRRFKKGDKVRILRRDISGIRCPYGTVVSVDGGLVRVRPVWHRWVMELYTEEIKIAEKIWDTEKQKSNIIVKEEKP